MTVVLTRMDERLIHGQITVAWRAAVGYRAIGVADDEAAAEAFERDLIVRSDPEAESVSVAPVAEAAAWYREPDSVRRLVLVRSPRTLRELVRAGAPVTEAVLGNRHPRPDRRRFLEYLHVSREDVEDLKDVASAGVRLTARDVPSGKAVDVNDAIAEGRLDFDHLPPGRP